MISAVSKFITISIRPRDGDLLIPQTDTGIDFTMKDKSLSIELRQMHGDAATKASVLTDIGPSRTRSLPTNSRALSTASESVLQVPVNAFDTLRWGEQLNGPHGEALPATSLPHEVPTTPPAISLAQENMVSIMPSLKSPYMNRWRAAACLVGYFTQGLNDGAVGALLPYLEHQYHISYSVVSILFMARTLGFLTAGPLTHKLNTRFGRSRTLGACAASNMCAFVLITTSPPYPLVVLAFFLSGESAIQ